MFDRAGTHRYGIVLLLVLLLVMFLVLAPTTTASRMVSLLLQGAVLVAVIVTSGESRGIRTRAGAITAVAVLVLVLLVGTEVLPETPTIILAAILILAPLPTLVRGLGRLLRTSGVTVEALSGALAVYLLVGLLFALVIGVVADVTTQPYFTNGTDADVASRVYYSFTTLTTTGFGDLTAATRTGHALAVLEMLFGQIYLVTIIGLLVGNLRSRGQAGTEAG